MAAAANGQVAFKGWNRSGRVMLENGSRIDVWNVNFRSREGWEPLGFQPGPFVIKNMMIDERVNGQRWRDYDYEAKYMNLVNSPYTMPAYGSFPQVQDPAHRDFWIMMPVMDGGEVDQSVRMLFRKKQRNGLFRFVNYMGTWLGQPDHYAIENASDFRAHAVAKHRLMIPIFLDIVYGLEDTHAHGVNHCDIKPQNILVSSKECQPGSCHAKIADFGIACGARIQSCWGHRAGTPAYWPPEVVIDEGSCTAAQDLWGMGLTLFAIWDGSLPQPIKREQSLGMFKVVLGRFSISTYLPADMNEDVKEAIKILMQHDPKKRNLQQAIRHLEKAHRHADLGLGSKQRAGQMQAMPYMGPLLNCIGQECQYACKPGGEPGCLCPPHLRLARDGKRCIQPAGAVEKAAIQVWTLVSDCITGLIPEGEEEDEEPKYYFREEDSGEGSGEGSDEEEEE